MKPQPLDLRREDYPNFDGPKIDRLIRALNASVGAANNILSGGFLLGENAKAFIIELPIVTRDEWIPLTLENSWTKTAASPVVSYHMDIAGNVHFRGIIQGGTFSTTLRIGSVPASYAPEVAKSRIVEAENAGGSHFPAYMMVDPSGDVFPHAGTSSTFPDLSGLTYHAEGKQVANGVFPVTFKNKLDVSPKGVIILRVVDVTTKTEIPISTTSLAWSIAKDQIRIHYIGGLPSPGTARCTMLVVGG